MTINIENQQIGRLTLLKSVYHVAVQTPCKMQNTVNQIINNLLFLKTVETCKKMKED